MRIFSPTLLSRALVCCVCATASAQTLARPGWAGSGLDADAWWRTAIFYRIDVAHFQDSNGDNTGDLRGIAQRLDYLQSLGIDAIILERDRLQTDKLQTDSLQTDSLASGKLPSTSDDTAFDDLLHAASAQRIRILVALSPADAPTLLSTARRWLTRGAAGIALPSALLKSNTLAVQQLHSLVASVPGQRVLLALPEAGAAARSELAHSDGADLIGLSTDIPRADIEAPFPAALRRALTEAQLPTGTSSSLLYSDNCCRTADAEFFPSDPTRTLGMNKITATRLLASRGATALLYGQELATLTPSTGTPATMRWTPSNITLPPPEPAPPTPPSRPHPGEDVYGAYVPYVAPKPARKPASTLDNLPGFSTAATPTPPSKTNAAGEAADPASLLNFYRRLIQLHHGNPSLRSGTPYVLDHDREQALVWVRRAPATARTAATVIVACNLSGNPLTLSLDSDLNRLHIRSGTLRPLLASWTETPTVQPTDNLQLPPYSVYIGELVH